MYIGHFYGRVSWASKDEFIVYITHVDDFRMNFIKGCFKVKIIILIQIKDIKRIISATEKSTSLTWVLI